MYVNQPDYLPLVWPSATYALVLLVFGIFLVLRNRDHWLQGSYYLLFAMVEALSAFESLSRATDPGSQASNFTLRVGEFNRGFLFAVVIAIALDVIIHGKQRGLSFKRQRPVTREEALGCLKERQEANGSAVRDE